LCTAVSISSSLIASRVEVARHQLVAGLGGSLHQRLAAGLLAGAHLVGDRHLLRLAVLVDVGVLLDHIHIAAE